MARSTKTGKGDPSVSDSDEVRPADAAQEPVDLPESQDDQAAPPEAVSDAAPEGGVPEPGHDTVETEPPPGGEPLAGDPAEWTDRETMDEPRSATAPEARDPAPPAPARSGSGGGFVAGLIGGVLGAGAVAGALWVLDPTLFQGGPDPEDTLAPVSAEIASQAARAEDLAEEVAALTDQIAQLRERAETPPPPPDTSDLESRIAALETAGPAEAPDLSALEERIAALESRPAGGDGAEAAAQQVLDAIAAERAELDRIASEAETRLAEAEARGEALRAASDAAAQAATARAALMRVQAALDSGGPFAEALAALQATTGQAAPPVLAEAAVEGVPTLPDLRASFPEAARDALAASRQAAVGPDAGFWDRTVAFLQAQTGARPLTPREGDGPDAILSRAEAALDAGDLAAALALAAELPEPGQAAMAGWRDAAERRLAALQAAADLAAGLGG